MLNGSIKSRSNKPRSLKLSTFTSRALKLRAMSAAIALSLAFSSTGLLPRQVAAGTLTDFYNDVGAVTSTGGGGAHHGQAMNVITGGSLFMRMPQKNYTLLGVTPPSLSMGCGGIDAYAGAFSHINKAGFVAMLKNIGQQAVGQAFMLALKSLAPEVASVMEYMQSVSQMVNGAQINSCEAGKGLADSALGKWMDANKRTAWTLGNARAADDDAAATRNRVWNSDTEALTEIQIAEASATGIKPQNGNKASSAIAKGNVVWRAMSQDILGLTIEQKTILMSLMGTVIFNGSDPANLSITTLNPTLQLSDLVGEPTGDSSPLMLQCTDGWDDDKCMVVQANPYPIRAFKAIVAERLKQVKDAMMTRTAQLPADIAFTNTVSIPIQRILSIGVIARAPGVAEKIEDVYGEVIAAEFAANFIRSGLNSLNAAINQAMKNKSSTETEELHQLLMRSQALRGEVMGMMQTAYQKSGQIQNIATQLETMERTMYGNMPAALQSAMAFEKSRAGR